MVKMNDIDQASSYLCSLFDLYLEGGSGSSKKFKVEAESSKILCGFFWGGGVAPILDNPQKFHDFFCESVPYKLS